MIDLLIALHHGLPRQGPGDLASTSRALALCTELPTAPDILDIGCGTGAQTLTLAAATTGRITALE
jgi:methylase of polypeptide subunit release factors